MLRMTPIRSGVEYLLRSAGCAEHDHQRDSRDAQMSGAEYLLGGSEAGEPGGVWVGGGLAHLGLAEDSQVTAEEMRTVFGRLEHLECDADGQAVPLGSRPRNYPSVQERVEAALAKEPGATEERIEQIKREAKAGKRETVRYYDLTFTPVKSVSVYRAALDAAGAGGAAAAVSRAHDQAVREALEFIESQVRTTRVGWHRTVTQDDGTKRTTGGYAEVDGGMVMTTWRHSSSRDGDPHLHTHAAILNRVMADNGKWYAVDGEQMKPLKGAADMIYERRLEELITEATGARFAWRPDGKTREIIGVDRALCDESSARRDAIQPELDRMVKDYRAEHGREPGRQAMAAMRRQAWADGRNPKTMESPEALADRYAHKHGVEHLKDQVLNVAEAAAKVETEGLPDGQPQVFATEDDLLREAVRRTQERYATWDETALALELNKLVGDVSWGERAPAEIQRMLGRALAQDGPADVVALVGRDRVRVPEALREGLAPEGLPVYRTARSLRYATREHLSAEKQLVAEAHATAGPVLDPAALAQVRVDLAGRGLSPDQLNAVVGILGSGKAADVLIGPAGTGKSTTTGELDRVWREQFGAPVLGLASSQRATDVLKGEGLDALNVAMFLTQYLPEDGSEPRRRLAQGTLIVVDEAGMADTDKLAKIARLVREAGGKLLYTGDHEQLAAVGTGGLLQLMTRDAAPFELAKVWRFKPRHKWEEAASLRLRVGDTTAVDEYERHGRLRGGTKAAMEDAAVRGYLADVLAGRESVLVVKSNDDAFGLSRRVRDELLSLGRVDETVLATLSDENACSAGDVVQARLNDHHPDAQNGQMVVNRELFTVLGISDDGGLEVRRHKDGSTVRFTSDYVENHVTLGYAGTVHSVQGLTVDGAHSLVERGMARNSVYVQATRGRDGNYLYVVCEVTGDEHEPESYSVSAAEVLREVVGTDGAQVSATETWRAALEDDDRLSTLGTVWELAARDDMADRHNDVLVNLLGPERMDQVSGDFAHRTLMSTLAHTEMSGYDVERVLTSVVGDPAELDEAASVAGVLRHRVDRHVAEAAERTVPGRWAKRAQNREGTVADYVHTLGQVIDARTELMARAAIIAPPDWALVALGPVPGEEDLAARETWAAKAAALGTYRELAAIDDDTMGIGAAPDKLAEPARHVAWHRAWDALGRPAEQADHQALTDDQLAETVRTWQREQQWAPVYVAPQLEKALTLAEEYRRDGITRWADVDAELAVTQGEITDEAQQLIDRAERAERLAARFTEASDRYERLDAARGYWLDHTAELAERARLAAAELDQRGVGPVAEPVQTELLDPDGGLDTPYARRAAEELEARAIDGELVDIEARGETRPEPAALDIIDAEVIEIEDPQPVVVEPVIALNDARPDQALDLDLTAGELDAADDPDNAAEPELAAAQTEEIGEEIGEILEAELVDEPRTAPPVEQVEDDIVDAEIVEEPARRVTDPAAETHKHDRQRNQDDTVRGDHGTAYQLDEIAEADATYPNRADADPDQLALLDVDDPNPRLRVDLGQVREDLDLTVRQAELRAALATEKIKGRELINELAADQAADAEAERRRAERERADRERQTQLQAQHRREFANRAAAPEPELGL